ncbi:MAG: hypothetical protein HQM16_17375 [Deltaproteobacteria bacterium]|nr:hypothetical protein [Deltaproteobacteria bacterium]
MTPSFLLYIVTYLSVATFVAAVVVKFLRFQKMPLHLRWELYPVAHEPGDKASYGGSKLEEVDWWKKQAKQSRLNELKAMIPEMLFLVALFENNKKLWWRSFPFHFGLYLIAGSIGLNILGTILELAGIPVTESGSIGAMIYHITPFVFIAGLFLATFGVLGLIQIRLFDAGTSKYSSLKDKCNLLLFLVVFIVAWFTFFLVDPHFIVTRFFIQNLLTLNFTMPVDSSLLILELFLTVLITAYIPLTHMAHFFLKWFTWHKIRWDDTANIRGGEIEKIIEKQVKYPVTWAAKHLNADGKKNWVDIATEELK